MYIGILDTSTNMICRSKYVVSFTFIQVKAYKAWALAVNALLLALYITSLLYNHLSAMSSVMWFYAKK